MRSSDPAPYPSDHAAPEEKFLVRGCTLQTPIVGAVTPGGRTGNGDADLLFLLSCECGLQHRRTASPPTKPRLLGLARWLLLGSNWGNRPDLKLGGKQNQKPNGLALFSELLLGSVVRPKKRKPPLKMTATMSERRLPCASETAVELQTG